jgi:hypothetical protein
VARDFRYSAGLEKISGSDGAKVVTCARCRQPLPHIPMPSRVPQGVRGARLERPACFPLRAQVIHDSLELVVVVAVAVVLVEIHAGTRVCRGMADHRRSGVERESAVSQRIAEQVK